jgi:hypothetical protein
VAHPADERAALVDLIERYGQRHSSDCTSRTPTHGHLREAFVVSLEPAKLP